MNTDTYPAKSFRMPSITRAAAGSLISAVHEAAAGIGFEAVVAVTDAGGHLKAFDRADTTPFLAAETAVGKAWTAASFHVATHVLNEYVANPKVAPLAHHPRLVAVGGGYPITEDGRCIGGLGVAGGRHEQDREAAEAALACLGFDVGGG
ncbi:heme-binding protein [Nocardia sp. BMG51109]|uniref:GlcG/HbpS family heme-binding protein n=1 Tax=Nocardia sp. BMG51109 TaxID=1056816 RepID=UPI000463E3E8|nr:heme-binding protein [Nocardia sp. BMG51109]